MPGITEDEDKIYNNEDKEEKSRIPNPLDIIRRDRDSPSGPGVPNPSP